MLPWTVNPERLQDFCLNRQAVHLLGVLLLLALGHSHELLLGISQLSGEARPLLGQLVWAALLIRFGVTGGHLHTLTASHCVYTIYVMMATLLQGNTWKSGFSSVNQQWSLVVEQD